MQGILQDVYALTIIFGFMGLDALLPRLFIALSSIFIIDSGKEIMNERYLGRVGQAIFYAGVIALGTYGVKNVLEGESIRSGLALSVASFWIIGESAYNLARGRKITNK